jgi:hypothetical protein
VLRPALVGLTVAGCAATAHHAAGGVVAPAAVVLVGVAGVMAAVLLRGRRLTSGQLLGLLALGQMMLHVAGPAAPHDVSMVSAHGTATVACLLALRHAEDFWWSLADHVTATLGIRAAAAPAPGAPAVLGRPSRRRGRPVAHGDRGRAPPVRG